MAFWQHHGRIIIAPCTGQHCGGIGGAGGAVICSGARVMMLWDWCYSAASWQCHSSTVMSLGWCWWHHGSTILNIDVNLQKDYLVFSWEKKNPAVSPGAKWL